MLNRLIEFSLNNRFLVSLAFLLCLGLGIWNLLRIPVDAFPDTTPVQVQVNTVAPALNAEEIEQQITLPVELSIGGLPGLANVRSVSKFGFSQVVATFDDSTEITDARQYMTERLATVELPVGIGRPELGPISTGLGEIFHYILRSDNKNRSLEDLRTLHDWVVKPELRKIPGVAEVNSWGGKERQFHVVVSPDALLKYNLTLSEVFTALEENNLNVGGGQLVSGGQSRLVHGLGRVSSIPEIENIAIAAYDGTPLFIRDIAEVRIGHEIRRGVVTAHGKGEAVLGLAFMLMGENSKVVTGKLKTQLNRIRKSLPADVIIEIVYDRTELVQEVIGTVKHNLIAGAVLVIIVLFILLGNIRAGLLVAITIPMAMMFAVLGMYHCSIAASLLSLGAIDFGIIVDGSVVMTEANLRMLAAREQEYGRMLTRDERRKCVTESSRQVIRSIVFGMGIIAVVFVPILALEDIEGKMFRPMALTFIFALMGALLIAGMLSPILGYYFLPKRGHKKESFVIRGLTAAYGITLSWAMRLRMWVLLALIVPIAVSGTLALRLGGEFIPRLSEGSIVINTIRLAGVSIDESVNYNTRIEQYLLEKFPDEIRYVWSRVGTAEVATDPMGIELTDIFLTLTPRNNWKQATSQEQLVARMQDVIAELPGLNMIFTQPIEMRMNEMVSGIRSDLGIKIYGDDFDELVQLSNRVQNILLEIEGASDIAVDQLTGQPALQIKVDQEQIARYGVSAREVLDYVEAIGTRRVGEVFEGQRKFPLVVRLPDAYRSNKELLADTLIQTETGSRVPLSQLADIQTVESSSTINREWGRRLIRVQCNVAGRDPASFVTEAKRRIDKNVVLPEGYVIDWGGQFENLERARLRLTLLVPLTLLIVFVLLYFSLKNLPDVLIIFTGIPLAAVGGVFSLWLRGMPFSVSAAIGFIALGGIAVLNGQILVSAIRLIHDSGISIREAVFAGAKQRLRPVLATAITDAVGFIPMAISTGVGAEVQRPLATVVIGGVITSTLLTLILLPLLYDLVNKKKDKQDRKLQPPGNINSEK
jgi:cobalt-zinc-cadmium resistance protein CzcA